MHNSLTLAWLAPQEDVPEPELSEEEQKKKEAQEAAAKKKELGNAAYKAKRFDEAIEHYDAAVALFDGDISFITNR